jgi:AraC family transcriptional regulator
MQTLAGWAGRLENWRHQQGIDLTMHKTNVAATNTLVPPEWMRSMPTAPLLSSELLCWRHICAYRFKHPARFQIQLPAASGHFLSAHLNNTCQLSARWNGTPRRIRSLPGDLIIMRANQENSWEGSGEIDELQIFIDPRLLVDAAAEFSDKTLGLVEGIGIRDPMVCVIAARIVEELSNPGSSSKLVGDAMAHALTAQLLSRHSNFRSVTAMQRIDMPAHKVRTAIEYIEAHLNLDLSIDLIAAAVNMSTFRFARGFKKETGRSPHQFLLERRIESAKDLLRSTDQKLVDIAQTVGFANQSHFAAVFRQRCRITPMAYRILTRPSG